MYHYSRVVFGNIYLAHNIYISTHYQKTIAHEYSIRVYSIIGYIVSSIAGKHMGKNMSGLLYSFHRYYLGYCTILEEVVM